MCSGLDAADRRRKLVVVVVVVFAAVVCRLGDEGSEANPCTPEQHRPAVAAAAAARNHADADTMVWESRG
jgi:hypothetical protein